MGRKLRSINLKYREQGSFGHHTKGILSLIISVFVIGLLSCACTQNASQEPENAVPTVENSQEEAFPQGENAQAAANSSVEIAEEENSSSAPTKMVSYDVSSIGRSDPFMPYDEYKIFSQARTDAITKANAYNAEISRIKSLQFTAVREADDISPYSFNLPVPPTELAGEGAAAAKITRTKVVGIMYNDQSPSAIINIDDKDYLVRPGDKIIGQEYMVDKISPTWITVTLGHNVYSAAIGEQFSKDEIIKQNDIYDLKNRFGGRKS